MQGPERSIDIRIPLPAAYERWVRWEDQPGFMQGVKRLPQPPLSGAIAHPMEPSTPACVKSAASRPVVWRAFAGSGSVARVTFSPIGPRETRVSVTLRWCQPLDDELGATLNEIAGVRLEHDLDRFASFIAVGPAREGARGIASGPVATATGPAR